MLKETRKERRKKGDFAGDGNSVARAPHADLLNLMSHTAREAELS